MSEPASISDTDALAALERFVVENDELTDLEAEIGRLNIFDALGIVNAEIRHSNFLAWLLDPAESHGQGQLFLRVFLIDLLREAPPADRPLSPVDLDGSDLRGVQIRREWRHIDLLIVAEEPRIVIAIENKIFAGEHSNQLERYKQVVESAFPDHKPLFVFLTREGDEPSDEAWCPYDYGRLYRALARCVKRNEDSIGEEVRVFVGHYLAMLRSRFMDDPKIDELVDRIYRNHRQALDLIFERRSDPRVRLTAVFADRLKEIESDWIMGDVRASGFGFFPCEWKSIVPPIYQHDGLAPEAWLFGAFRVGPRGRRAWIEFIAGPTTDQETRDNLIEAIRLAGPDSGFELSRKKTTKVWTRIQTITVARSHADVLDDDQNTIELIRRSAEQLPRTVEQMTTFLRGHFA
ncbi:MAG: PD-(D/E)XK nuclease family protein [Phycisphaeraceae bacterium]|nr:MAG: PD-(D/E)XK nuclease family protein [Phycisphaeraceae bacterium]